MYGPVRTLSETMETIGLAKKPVLTESDKKDRREKAEKKRMIAEARKTKEKNTITESGTPKKGSTSKNKGRIETLLEEVETLDTELEQIKNAKPEETNSDKPADGLDKVTASLKHVINFANEARKKYEWRKDGRSKGINELFCAIREEAEGMIVGIKKGDISEEDGARTKANPLIKRFVEAVGVVRDAFNINDEVFNALKDNLKNVK